MLRSRQLYEQCSKLLAELKIPVSPRARVGRLPVAARQLVEIAKALSRSASLVIMDEPTASLTNVEQEHLFGFIRRLRERGAAVLYVSHRLDEIFEVADEVTVLRDGKLVRTVPIRETDKRRMIAMMVGRDLAENLYPRRPSPETRQGLPPAVLAVDRLLSPGKLRGVRLQLRPGEIVGIAGLMGSGRTSLLRALFGADPEAEGEVRIGNRSGIPGSPQEAIAAGLGFITEDRKLEGLAISLSVLANLTATRLPGQWGLYRSAMARESAMEVAEQVHLAPRAIGAPASWLSGGNQQKVVLGKWLATTPRILLCDEPTRGIDVGARAEMYELLRRLAADGMAILFASSELGEVLGLADRVLVMSEGSLVAEFDAENVTEEVVMRAAAGLQEVES